jgi:hypothetical protein
MGDGCEGAVAQLGERRPCKAEVVGSSPISSTNRRGAGAPGRRGAEAGWAGDADGMGAGQRPGNRDGSRPVDRPPDQHGFF